MLIKLIFFVSYVHAKIIIVNPDGNFVFKHYRKGATTFEEDMPKRDYYTVLSKLVWHDQAEAANLWENKWQMWKSYHLFPHPVWIEQPVDWQKEQADIKDMPGYNARMFWRYFSLMRSKAFISPKCWRRNTSIYTHVTFIQIYHDPGEPYFIPCYICQRAFERNGQPKLFRVLDKSRNLFHFDTKGAFPDSIPLSEFMIKKMLAENKGNPKVPEFKDYPYKSGGLEWQFEQGFGENYLSGGGDGLHVTPNFEPDLTLANYGTFFCTNLHINAEIPDVVVNVDVIVKDKTMKPLDTDDISYQPPILSYYSTDRNYECFVWEKRACPATCDDKKEFRKGYPAVRKINPREPLVPPDGFDWIQWRSVDAYLSTSPYREDGIPLYSSFWFEFPQVQEEIKRQCGAQYVFKIYVKSELKNADCASKKQCEENELKNLFYTSVDDTSYDGGPAYRPDSPTNGDQLPSREKICPIDIDKHTEITTNAIGQGKSDVSLQEHLKYYVFTCVSPNNKGPIYWKNGTVPLDKDCNDNSPIFVRNNQFLHYHRPPDGENLILTCHNKKTKLGDLNVAFKKSVDWRGTIVTTTVLSIVLFLTCPLCMVCARGVKNATKMAVDVAVMAADMQTGGMVGGVLEGQKQKEEEEKEKQERVMEQRIQNQLAMKRVKQDQQQ